MEPKYVIQRTNTETGQIDYLSPGRVRWVSEEAHKKYGTRYGKWLWSEAETISSDFNHIPNSGYSYVALSEKNHK